MIFAEVADFMPKIEAANGVGVMMPSGVSKNLQNSYEMEGI